MKQLSKHVLALLLLTGLTSCSSNDDAPLQINEEELINQVEIQITETGTAITTTYNWIEGGESPEPIVLNTDNTYEVAVRFLNSTNPNNIIDITEEVIEEADEHLVFYESLNAGLTISPSVNDEEDQMGNKLGVFTSWSTGMGTTSGNVLIYLIHEPTSKSGTDRDAIGGETDVQVSFNVIIN